MFLRIENPVNVVPSVELLRTLGASSSRGHEEKIGQFGSGTPNAMALLVRKGLRTKFCLGTDVYTLTTKAVQATTATGDSMWIEEILMKKQGGATVNLNISTQFGAMDWTQTGMALRELISNAIDGGQPTIELVEDNECRAKKGTIRVYVEVDEDVKEYYSNLRKYFLCLDPFYNKERTILPNQEHGPARLYRKGVLVGTFGQHSLFHYNVPDLSLKESRNVDSYAARERAAELIRDSDTTTIMEFIRSFGEDEHLWEHDLHESDFSPTYAANREQVIQNWTTAYKIVHGDSVLCADPMLAKMVRDKGYPAFAPPTKLWGILSKFGMRNSLDVLTKDEVDGRTITSPTQDVVSELDKMWTLLEMLGMLNGKDKPEVKCFSEITKSEGNRLGYYREGTVYILSDIASRCFMLTQTMIEELAHHVTGAMDCTREFQDFAFRLAAHLSAELT
jgi:hypothetical protein